MLGMFILSMFFTTMFILAKALHDPLGNDLDDYDIDSLLQQREMRINASIEQLSDALAKLKESQAATNDEILHRLRDLDKKL